jgi:hypothetical protein
MGLAVNQWLVEFDSQMRSQIWGISSSARALHLQCRGDRLDTGILHQPFVVKLVNALRLDRSAERLVSSSLTEGTNIKSNVRNHVIFTCIP